MKKSKIDYNYIFIILVLLILCLFPSFANTYTSAEERVYSGVLEDLQKDEDFNIDNYPVNVADYSLQVIQIAESEDDELFIYVYQPSADYVNLRASSINISSQNSIKEDGSKGYLTYDLIFINSYNTLFKYRVSHFSVVSELERWYEITGIYRPFDEKLDDEVEDDNVDQVVYNVSKKWTFTTTDNGIEVKCEDIETIEITSQYVGFVRYDDGNWWKLWGESACDRHFIAFSTDRDIDELLEADVYFQTQSAHFRDYLSGMYVDSWTFGEPEDNYRYLTYTDTGSYEGLGGIDWSRIQTVDEFVDTVNLEYVYSIGLFDVEFESKMTEEGMESLKEKQWVLSFVETAYEVKKSGHEENYYSTRIGNVTILRLKFETNGIVYNLGVISNKQSSDGIQDNDMLTKYDFAEWFKWVLRIIGIILLVVLVVACWPIVSVVLSAILKAAIWLIKMIGKGLGYFFYGLWWVISSPIALFDEDGA